MVGNSTNPCAQADTEFKGGTHMPDEMDRLQEADAAHNDDSMRRHADRVTAPGRATCANMDCEEGISAARQQLGAQLCLDCQKAEEAQSAHFRTWRGGRR